MSTVSKGKEFENRVAELFRIMGYKVEQNIEICHKKVDVLATLQIPGSDTLHRIIVECKHEAKNINQVARVREFKDLLREAREQDKADSAEIITLKPWSDQAKGVALGSGVKLYTYTQKLAQLMNFDGYLASLIDDFENDDLSKYYIDLNAERGTSAKGVRLHEKSPREEREVSPLDLYISDWLKTKVLGNQITILGEFGSGKTSFCRHYAYELAKKYKKNKEENVRIPILFNLGKFTKNVDFEDLIVGYLDRKCGVSNPKFSIFKKMNDEGLFLLMFDGFDEMAVQVDLDTILGNLNEIEKLTKSTESKVLLTSRPEYFVSAEEEEELFAPSSLLEKERKFDRLYLIPLNETQIRYFLRRRIPLIEEAEEDWKYYLEKIRELHDLSDLSKRPVMLDMITKTLPQLIKAQKPITAANLYQTYLEGEIKRQAVDKKRRLLIKREHRFLLMQTLAIHFYKENLPGVTAKQIKELIKDEFTSRQQEELEAHLRDFLTCSFLVREGDNYRFSHRSIVEYLTAKGVYDEIQKDKPNIFQISPLTKEIRDFILELKPDKEVLWKWIESTKNKSFENVKYLGGNAISLLNLLGEELKGKDFSNTVLQNAYLQFTDVTGTNFKGAQMKNADLNNTILKEADFSYADLEGAILGELDVIRRIAWSPDGNYILAVIGESWKPDGTNLLGIWDARTYKNASMLKGHTKPINAICWDSSAKQMVSGAHDYHLIVWDMENFRIKMKTNPHVGAIWHGTFIGNNLVLCCGSGFGAKLVDTETGEIKNSFLEKYSRIYFLGILDNFLIVTLDSDSETPDRKVEKDHSRMIIWDMNSNRKIKSYEYNILSWCHLLDDNRKKIITAQKLDDKGRIQLNEMDYSLQNENVLWNCGEPIRHMIWSPNRRFIALSIGENSQGSSIVIWDYRERKIVARLKGHNGFGYSTWFSFSPDSKYLASGGTDKIIKIWDVDTESKTFGRCVYTIRSQINCRGMKIGSVEGLSEEKVRFLKEQGAMS